MPSESKDRNIFRIGHDKLRASLRYLSVVVGLNFLWEVAQLPLYTIWNTASIEEIAFDVVHCTIGDLLIAISVLLVALFFVGSEWPNERRTHRCVAILTITSGVGYTIFSEWLNVTVRQSWAYSDWMPVLPFLGTGLSPTLQWIVIPIAAFWWSVYRSPKYES